LRWRQLWAVMANICLAAHGHPARIDHRSYAERTIALEPQNKIGHNAARRAALMNGWTSTAPSPAAMPGGLRDALLGSSLNDRQKPGPANAGFRHAAACWLSSRASASLPI